VIVRDQFSAVLFPTRRHPHPAKAHLDIAERAARRAVGRKTERRIRSRGAARSSRDGRWSRGQSLCVQEVEREERVPGFVFVVGEIGVARAVRGQRGHGRPRAVDVLQVWQLAQDVFFFFENDGGRAPREGGAGADLGLRRGSGPCVGSCVAARLALATEEAVEHFSGSCRS